MGVPEPADSDDGPVLPDLPYLSVSALARRLSDLFFQAEGLALPWIATVDEANQLLALELGPGEQTVIDILAWSARFGAVVQSHSCGAVSDGLSQHVSAIFEFCGVTVSVFAFIPCNGQEDQRNDNRY